MKLARMTGALALSAAVILTILAPAAKAEWISLDKHKITDDFTIQLDDKHALALQMLPDQILAQFSKSALFGKKVSTDVPFVCTISSSSQYDQDHQTKREQVSLEITLGDDLKAEIPSLKNADHLQLDLMINTVLPTESVNRMVLITAVNTSGASTATLFHDFIYPDEKNSDQSEYPDLGQEGSYFSAFKCK